MQVFILDMVHGPYHMDHMKLGDNMGPLKCQNYKRLNMVCQGMPSRQVQIKDSVPCSKIFKIP